MGNSDSSNSTALKIDHSQWKQIGNQNGVKIVTSTRGQGEGQQQIIPLDLKSSIQKQYKVYNYRKNQDKALVKVHGVQSFQKKSIGMCGSQQTIKVITQRMRSRWSNLPQLTLAQCLYALNQSLKGYRDCYEKIGSFQVTQDMIGINQNGQLKVWVNKNFAKNHPDLQKPFLQTSGQNKYNDLMSGGNQDEQDMVKNVIDVIQERCQQGRYPPQLRKRLHMCQTFLTAQTQVQKFAQIHNIWVPDKIHPNVIVTKLEENSIAPNNNINSYQITNNNLNSFAPVQNNLNNFNNNQASHTHTNDIPVISHTLFSNNYVNQQPISQQKYMSGVNDYNQYTQNNDYYTSPIKSSGQQYHQNQINYNLPSADYQRGVTQTYTINGVTNSNNSYYNGLSNFNSDANRYNNVIITNTNPTTEVRNVHSVSEYRTMNNVSSNPNLGYQPHINIGTSYTGNSSANSGNNGAKGIKFNYNSPSGASYGNNNILVSQVRPGYQIN